jgi:hypothetical protein
MFQRMILEDSAVLYTIAAFSVASSIFVAVAWRAMRMSRSQLERFANLPFETATPASKHERRSDSSAD